MLVLYRLLPVSVVAAIVLAGLAADANASLELRLTDLASGATTTIMDEGALDGAIGTSGIITFIGTVGNFTLDISTGTSKPISGTSTLPHLTLTTTSITSAASVASTLTIELTDTGFGPSPSPLGFSTITNSANPGTQSVTVSSFIDLSNAKFGTGTPLSSLGPSSGSFNNSGTTSVLTGSPYSTTLVTSVTHGVGNGLSVFDAAVLAIPTPEPVSLFTWAGLTCMALARGRRRR